MEKLCNRLIVGDCIKVLAKTDKPFADLIFADPPFNIGYKYDKYNDKVKHQNYVCWTKDWMQACYDVLKPNGCFYIAIGDDYAANVKMIADELGLFLRNWLIWHYTFGQQTKNKFARSHTHILYFVKDKDNFTFNDYAIRVPSDRQLLYNDKRANPAGKLPDDVWGRFPRVCGTFKERAGWHPCQMPEMLLKRIIAVSSNSKDLVLDPFIGSGTTAAAAYQSGRNYLGIDISRDYVQKVRERLGKLKRQKRASSLNFSELNEIERLVCDMAMPAVKIAADTNLLKLFANQLSVRINNHKQYRPEKIAIALKELAC